MHELERYALLKDRDKDLLKQQAQTILLSGELDDMVLRQIVEKAYQIGHSAGHCRGELHMLNLQKERVWSDGWSFKV